MEILKRIETLMKLHGWSEYQLAKTCEMPTSNIKNMFDRDSVPEIPTIEKIAGAFGLTMAQFFTEEEEPFPVTAEERAALEAWDFLTPEQKKIVLDLMLHMNRPPQK